MEEDTLEKNLVRTILHISLVITILCSIFLRLHHSVSDLHSSYRLFSQYWKLSSDSPQDHSLSSDLRLILLWICSYQVWMLSHSASLSELELVPMPMDLGKYKDLLHYSREWLFSHLEDFLYTMASWIISDTRLQKSQQQKSLPWFLPWSELLWSCGISSESGKWLIPSWSDLMLSITLPTSSWMVELLWRYSYRNTSISGGVTQYSPSVSGSGSSEMLSQ